MLKRCLLWKSPGTLPIHITTRCSALGAESMPMSSGNPLTMQQPQKQPQPHQLRRSYQCLPLC